ncbi:hypothetical protein C3L33_00068, partial [Rhododendron williamsianum]
MKNYCYLRSLAAFVLALVLILHSSAGGAQASRLLLAKEQSSSAASQAFHDLQPDGKEDPFKKVGSSLKICPPTGQNPTQNK